MPGVIIIAFFIVACGYFLSLYLGRIADARIREDLAGRTADVAGAINVDLAKKLTFSDSDKDLPEFRRLRDNMVSIAMYPDKGFSKVYTVKMKPGGFYFGPEGYGPDDPSSVEPGTIYENPPTELKEVFTEKRTRTAGPYSDEFGTFISAFVPLIDPLTGKVLLAVGIDIDACLWQSEVARAQRTGVIFTVLLLAVLFAGRFLFNWRTKLSEEKKWRLRHIEAYLTLVTGFMLTFFIAGIVYNAEVRSREKTFQVLARTVTDSIKDDLYDIRVKMRTIESFFRASEYISRQEFHKFAEPLTRDGIVYAWVWAPAVPASQVKDFEEQARREGFNNYSIFQVDETGRHFPVSIRDVYYPNFYRESPLNSGGGALGFDFGSEPSRRAALEGSSVTRLPTSTEPITFFALEGTPQGILIFQPVRTATQEGFIVAGVKIKAFLTPMMQRSGMRGLGVSADIFYLKEGSPPEMLFSTLIGRPKRTEDSRWVKRHLSLAVPVFAFGKTYAVNVYPEDAYLAANRLQDGWITAIAGLLLTLALTFIVAVLSTRNASMEREIRIRTGELDYQYRFEKLVADVAAFLMGMSSKELDYGVNHVLKLIGEFFKVDRCYVVLLSEDGKYMNNTHEWCGQGVKPQIDRIQNMPMDAFPFWKEQMEKKEQFCVADVDDMPAELQAEKEELLIFRPCGTNPLKN